LSFTRPDVTHCRYRALGRGHPHYTNRLNGKPPNLLRTPTTPHTIMIYTPCMQGCSN
jgi:hypothetical protein